MSSGYCLACLGGKKKSEVSCFFLDSCLLCVLKQKYYWTTFLDPKKQVALLLLTHRKLTKLCPFVSLIDAEDVLLKQDKNAFLWDLPQLAVAARPLGDIFHICVRTSHALFFFVNSFYLGESIIFHGKE